jgi:hypothetical protein
MTKEALTKRLNDLKVQHERAVAQVNALVGAISVTEQYLAEEEAAEQAAAAEAAKPVETPEQPVEDQTADEPDLSAPEVQR